MLKNTFKELLTKTQEELLSQLPVYLKKKGYRKVIEEDYAIGFISPYKNQPTLVAHLDTINTKRSGYSKTKGFTGDEKSSTPCEKDLIFTEKYILLSPEANPNISCLGADDRVGVKTILNLVDKGHKFNILFTTNEESGCLGTRELIKGSTFDFLEDTSMFIQIDRGSHENAWNEMVFYDFDIDKYPTIKNKLEEYYTLATGSYTDVAVLGPHFDKPIVNLSASYANEHTTREFINLHAFRDNLRSLDLFLKWLYTQDTSSWKWEEVTHSYGYGKYYGNYNTNTKPSYEWREPREIPKDTTIAEMINDMYIYANKDKKVSYSWNFFVSECQRYGEDYKVDYAEYYIRKCYENGLYMKNYYCMTNLFSGVIYADLLELKQEEDDFWEESLEDDQSELIED